MELRRALFDYDLNFLRTVAQLWGLPEPTALKAREAAEVIAAGMLSSDAVRAQVEALPASARTALDSLVAAGGRQPVPRFIRDFGEIRAMGPARRDRERPWLSPASPAEAVYYRGLIFRGFFEARPSPQECFFVPDDLLALIPPPLVSASPSVPGQPARSPAQPRRTGTAIVDDACTLLAYLQTATIKATANQPIVPSDVLGRHRLAPEAFDLLLHLLQRLGLAAGSPLKPQPTAARPFLEASRAEQLRALATAWRDDPDWDDLRRVPGLEIEGAWINDPLTARSAILDLLALIPVGEWWSLRSFVAAVKERAPDFQRPAGDYDSWYLRDAATGEYLRGFENWERVDGALIAYLIAGPLHWLGLAEIAESTELPAPAAPGKSVDAFRLTPLFPALIGHTEWKVAERAGKVTVRADASLTVPRAASRYDRFQIARVSEWIRAGDLFEYRLSPASLARAAEQGVTVRHILAFLKKAAGNPIPRSLSAALQAWEQDGAQARLQEVMVLKVKSAAVLERLQRSPKTRRYLGEALGPLAVEVRRGEWEKLRAAMLELGIMPETLPQARAKPTSSQSG